MRTILLLAFAAGGVWGTIWIVDEVIRRAGNSPGFHLVQAGLPLVIPVGMVGAFLGACIGGLLLPLKR